MNKNRNRIDNKSNSDQLHPTRPTDRCLFFLFYCFGFEKQGDEFFDETTRNSDPIMKNLIRIRQPDKNNDRNLLKNWNRTLMKGNKISATRNLDPMMKN